LGVPFLGSSLLAGKLIIRPKKVGLLALAIFFAQRGAKNNELKQMPLSLTRA
jgi:hypothetical protein